MKKLVSVLDASGQFLASVLWEERLDLTVLVSEPGTRLID